MDKFGYIRGRRGAPGPPGKDALELHTWAPNGVLEMIRKNNECTFYFDSEKDGIIDGGEGKIALKDRFGNNNAMCLSNFQKPVKIGKFYGLPLKDTLYKIENCDTATIESSICVVALQFKLISKISNEDDYIFTNETGSRGVTVSKKALNILGTDPMDLAYTRRGWNTLLIQWSCIEKDQDGKCFFILNGRRGEFTPHTEITRAKDLYLGGHQAGKQFANVMISSFEIYFRIIDNGPDGKPLPYLMPKEMLQVIEDGMTFRVEKPDTCNCDF